VLKSIPLNSDSCSMYGRRRDDADHALTVATPEPFQT